MVKINLHPTVCNLCGGKVIFTSNGILYGGREFGSGKCYYCTLCHASVGTHEPEPDKAKGILADLLNIIAWSWYSFEGKS